MRTIARGPEHTGCGLLLIVYKMIDRILSLLAPYGVSTELEYLNVLAYLMIGSGIAAFVALAFVQAPYGKYAEKAQWYYGFPVNGTVAWVVQELPSFVFAVWCWYAAATSPGSSTAAELTSVSPRTVLLAMYVAHYFQRTFIFPFLIRGGKPTPFVVMMMALAFCVWNG